LGVALFPLVSPFFWRPFSDCFFAQLFCLFEARGISELFFQLHLELFFSPPLSFLFMSLHLCCGLSPPGGDVVRCGGRGLVFSLVGGRGGVAGGCGRVCGSGVGGFRGGGGLGGMVGGGGGGWGGGFVFGWVGGVWSKNKWFFLSVFLIKVPFFRFLSSRGRQRTAQSPCLGRFFFRSSPISSTAPEELESLFFSETQFCCPCPILLDTNSSTAGRGRFRTLSLVGGLLHI